MHFLRHSGYLTLVSTGIPGLYVQNLSASSDSDHMMIALLMEYGGHHTDLMFSNATHDPPDVTAGRRLLRHVTR